MAQGERTGKRLGSFSMWHRKKSLQRFTEGANSLYLADFDHVEYGYLNGEPVPLVLMEVTSDINADKSTIIQLSRMLLQYHPITIPFVVVKYTKSPSIMCEEHQTGKYLDDLHDIQSFNIEIYDFKSSKDAEYKDENISPQGFVNIIKYLRIVTLKDWEKLLIR